MKKSDFVWNEFIYGGHWFSISSSALALSMMVILQTPIRWELILIIYLLIQSIYNFNHYKEFNYDKKQQIERVSHISFYYRIMPILITLYIFLFFFLLIFYGEIKDLIFGLLLLIIGFLFTTFFKEKTRKIIAFKNVYASFSLSLIILFTAFYCNYNIDFFVVSMFIYFSLRFLVSSIFSDIKDLQSDKKRKLLTIPVFFGREKTILMLHFLNVITSIILFLFFIQINITYIFLVLFSSIYTFYYLKKICYSPDENNSITNILVDGEFIFWPLLLLPSLYFF
jgi:4-hydroxybenzoate polyprenyltransferase